jgi:hypothetical protein
VKVALCALLVAGSWLCAAPANAIPHPCKVEGDNPEYVFTHNDRGDTNGYHVDNWGAVYCLRYMEWIRVKVLLRRTWIHDGELGNTRTIRTNIKRCDVALLCKATNRKWMDCNHGCPRAVYKTKVGGDWCCDQDGNAHKLNMRFVGSSHVKAIPDCSPKRRLRRARLLGRRSVADTWTGSAQALKALGVSRL